MKRLLALLLFCVTITASAQYHYGISATYQPIDNGWGCMLQTYFVVDTAYVPRGAVQRADTIPFTRFGIYAAYAHGNYRYSSVSIDDHDRYEFGVSWAVWPPYIDEKIYTHFTLGIVYHTFGEVRADPFDFNKYALEPLSATFGIMNTFGHMTFRLRYDPFKGESCIDLGCLF